MFQTIYTQRHVMYRGWFILQGHSWSPLRWRDPCPFSDFPVSATSTTIMFTAPTSPTMGARFTYSGFMTCFAAPLALTVSNTRTTTALELPQPTTRIFLLWKFSARRPRLSMSSFRRGTVPLSVRVYFSIWSHLEEIHVVRLDTSTLLSLNFVFRSFSFDTIWFSS